MNENNVPLADDSEDRASTELRDLASTPRYREAAARFTHESGFGEVAEYAEGAGLRWPALCVAVLNDTRQERQRTE